MMKNENAAISRTKFLKKLGLNGAAIFAATYCAGALSACENESGSTTPINTGGTKIDLSDPQYSKLKTKGSYVIVNKIVVANTSEGKYAAVPLMCSHEGRLEVTYRTNEFYCTAHGARFDNAGKGLNSDGRNGLKLFTVTQEGTILTIT
jgi:cytochrome b6-f complex iron-sulfur subunit